MIQAINSNTSQATVYSQRWRRLTAHLAVALVTLTTVVACSPSNRDDLAEGVRIDWRDLYGLDPVSGKVSPDLRALLRQTVRIPGFVVPFEDMMTEASTFLLVPNFGACVHLPAPEANQMVLVEMADDKAVHFDLWSNEPIWVIGELSASEFDSPWGAVGFRMTGHDSMSFRDGLDEGDRW